MDLVIPMTFRYKGDDVYDTVTLAMAEVLKSGTNLFSGPHGNRYSKLCVKNKGCG
jgi:hypothetical protein